MLGWVERAIVWPVSLGRSGIGKSPAQALAFGPLRAWNEQLLADYILQLEAWQSAPANQRPARPPKDPSLLIDDVTIEGIARALDGTGSLGLDADELSDFLAGLGQYKDSAQGGNSDRRKLLKLWTGTPWRYTRVGVGGKTANAINIYISKPQLVICGPLPAEQHLLLGGDRDGLRPRWLPHLAQPTTGNVPGLVDTTVDDWSDALGALLSERGQPRQWKLDPQARETFQDARSDWRKRGSGDGSPSVLAAISKADVHALRITLAFAEIAAPGAGGEVPSATVEGAVTLVQYTIDVWRYLGTGETVAFTRRDEQLNTAIVRLVAWLDRQGGGPVNSDKIRKNNVGGVQTASELSALLRRYEAIYPGTVRLGQRGPKGGAPPMLIYAPDRHVQRP
jgi:hypothetical protein